MHIKSKVHFFSGLFCLLCLVIGILNHIDTFISACTVIAAFVNIYIGLFYKEDE